ncbi:IS3 family transposase [Lewinella sp. W8]|uniref:IS3 family transposase n=1 Tax=Lewinella sp. W8 TaxID=2528208 RepID=UPI0012B64743|nr:IS3 family transposase [Lewinella sp. W8]
MDSRQEFSVEKMSKVFGVSRSGFYKWLNKHQLAGQQVDPLDAAISSSFDRSRRTYGSPRVALDLKQQGILTSKSSVARRMRQLKLAARKPKRWTRTTLVNEDNPVAPNLLNRDFAADRPATKWVSDISYFSIKGSWHYLTIILDLADRAIVGWAISDEMSAQTTSVAALERAVARRKPKGNLIFHSDRGVQYTCDKMRQRIAAIGAVQSMSRKGNCLDNAVAESFFKTIKEECIDRHEFTSRAHAWSIIFDYIEVWYNTNRIHTTLKGLTVRKRMNEKQKLKCRINQK